LGEKINLSSPGKKAKRCLGLFARDPFAGESKSRLSPLYNKNFREGIAESFLKDTFRIADLLDGVDKVLNYSPPQSADRMRQYLLPGWKSMAQEGEDLGWRMESFFSWAFLNGYHQVILIGSDFPTLPPKFLSQAFELLDKRPLVLGPSTDGGYYLIGLSRPYPEIFQGIKWSSEQVFAQTVERVDDDIGLLLPWYDVDVPDDLAILAGHLRGMLKAKQAQLPEHTLRFLRQHHLL
jgi:rSAM/selenodomain-associated transferase 1